MDRSDPSRPAARTVISPGRVAVVTGAASGIGLELSRRLGDEGLRVVMADVEEPALAAAAGELASTGADVLPVVTDVADLAAVTALRDRALDRYGAVHLLCNNAGVGGPHGPIWECPRGEWDWVLGVNLGGVINGLRAFMPTLLAQDAAHVLNTSSVFGVFAGALGPYGISKHAVTALTETLFFNLQALGVTHVGVSVLCPGAVRTNFGTSARNRPAWAGPPPDVTSDERASTEQFDRLSTLGASPAQVAGTVVSGIRSGRFYILTSDNRNGSITRRAQEILNGTPPAPPFPSAPILICLRFGDGRFPRGLFVVLPEASQDGDRGEDAGIAVADKLPGPRDPGAHLADLRNAGKSGHTCDTDTEDPAPHVESLTDAQLTALVKARQGNSFIDRLGTALVRLMADTGCRIGEACSLTLADVDLHAGVVTFRRTKNGDVRQVGIGPSLARESAKINAFEAALKAGTIKPWKADPVTLVQPLPA